MESRSADSLPITKWRGVRELAVVVAEVRCVRAEVRKARRHWRGRSISDGVCAGSCGAVAADPVMDYYGNCCFASIAGSYAKAPC